MSRTKKNGEKESDMEQLSLLSLPFDRESKPRNGTRGQVVCPERWKRQYNHYDHPKLRFLLGLKKLPIDKKPETEHCSGKIMHIM